MVLYPSVNLFFSKFNVHIFVTVMVSFNTDLVVQGFFFLVSIHFLWCHQLTLVIVACVFSRFNHICEQTRFTQLFSTSCSSQMITPFQRNLHSVSFFRTNFFHLKLDVFLNVLLILLQAYECEFSLHMTLLTELRNPKDLAMDVTV